MFSYIIILSFIFSRLITGNAQCNYGTWLDLYPVAEGPCNFMTLDVNYTAFEFSCDPDDNGGSIFYYNNTECAGTPMYSSQSEYFDCSMM